MRRYLDPRTLRGPFAVRDAAQPNIILISTDMVPPEFVSSRRAPGNAPMRTPALDRLRRDGTTFANAFCASPLCTPSRAAYLTGRMAYITTNSERAHDGHAIHLREHDPIFPEYLKSAGYHARHVGKCHVGGARFLEVFGENDSPWDRWGPPWYDDDGYIRFLADRGLGRYEFSRRIVGRDPAGLDTAERPGGNAYGGWLAPQGGRPFPQDATYPAYLVDRALAAIDARRDSGRPLYLQLDFFEPHQPFAIPGGRQTEDREREIRSATGLPDSWRRLAANGFEAPWREPRVYRMYRANWGLTDERTALDYRVANQLQMEHVDAAIGRFLEGLAARGLYDASWVFFLADHGEMNGELALVDKGAYLRPQVIRAPLLVKPPRGGADGGAALGRGATVEAPASLLDLAPTVLEAAGIESPEACDGMSLARLAELAAQGSDRPTDRPVLFDVWSHVVPNPAIGTVFRATGGGLHLFSYNAADDIDELYALGGEREDTSVWGESAHSAVEDEAVQLMDRLLAADPRWVGYSHAFRLDYRKRLTGAGGDRQLFE
jgi:arylsulfatase A-like enzyme